MRWVTRERPKIDRIATALTLASLVSTSLGADGRPPGRRSRWCWSKRSLSARSAAASIISRSTSTAERLFVAELGNNSLGVVDLAAGKAPAPHRRPR